MPFDAMKGLQEALRDREERHLRTERRELSEEQAAELNAALSRLRDGLGDCDHLVRFAHHSGACAPARYFGDGAAEVDVHHIRSVAAGNFGGAVGHAGGLHHGFGDMTVYLYAHGGFAVFGAELRDGLGGVADEPVGGHELREHHIGTLLTAQHTERRVCHVFHRCQNQGTLPKVDIAYFHGLIAHSAAAVNHLAAHVR